MLQVIGEVTGLDVTPEITERRAGDPPRLVAQADAIRDGLGFHARYDLSDMVSSAWEAWRHQRA